MSLVADFSFQTLEPLAPPRTPVSDAEAVLDVLAEAREDADRIREDARNQGYAAGRADAVASLEPAIAALTQAIADLRAQQADMATELERRAVELGLALSKKIVGVTVGLDPTKVVGAVEMALRGIVERGRITVLVNPDDLEIVR